MSQFVKGYYTGVAAVVVMTLVLTLLRALQEQNRRVKDLERKIASLKDVR